MNPIFFTNRAGFRAWLEQNHDSAAEIIVGYYKSGSGRKGLSWEESVEEALCFGWIDSVRRSVDEQSYCNRFTPRRAGSTWSLRNIRKVEELIAGGRMHPAGIKAFEQRKEENSGRYSFENERKELPDPMLQQFRRKITAWQYFEKQSASYRRTVTHWILSARKEETKQSRLQKLIDASARNERLF
jgi:uncharacterized protein YdeI (YjbR/CyaY-like superfamily)